MTLGGHLIYLDLSDYICEIQELDEMTFKFILTLIFFCPMISKC